MADNLVANPGSGGATVAFDNLGGAPPVYVQLVKVCYGANDTKNYVSSSAGLPVAQQGTFTVGISASQTIGLSAGAAKVGVFTTDQTTPGTTDLVHAAQSGTWNVNATAVAGTSGGGTPFHLVSAATLNTTSVKTTAGQVFSLAGYNNNAAARFLKIFDKATAPVCGTDTPIWTMELPGNTAGAGANMSFPIGVVCTLGIGIAITGAIADNDTTTVGAGDCVVNVLFK